MVAAEKKRGGGTSFPPLIYGNYPTVSSVLPGFARHPSTARLRREESVLRSGT